MMTPYHPFVKAVARALRHRCGLQQASPQNDHKLIVATSGGADSVALLHALAVLSRRRRWRLDLTVGHAQHHLRDDAEADAQFVADLAGKLRLPFLRADLEIDQTSGNVESLARRARYKALADMADQCGAKYVVTAHHGDDQLETLLMRLIRGSSVRGLGSMAWRRNLMPGHHLKLLRPMLAVTHDDACRFLEDLNQPWCHDHTNADVSRLRAKLRHEVLPVLRSIRPGVAGKAVAVTDQLRQAHHLIESEIDQQMLLVTREDDAVTLDRRHTRVMPRIVLAGLLRRVLTDAGTDADRIGQRRLEPLLRAIRDRKGGTRVFEFSGGLHLTVTRDQITLSRRAHPSTQITTEAAHVKV